ncbi:MAG: hypothetical protein ACKVOB_06530 [Sphingomonas sp.]
MTLFSHFFSQNAVTPENAVGWASPRFVDRRLFDRMKASGVIVEASPGLFYVAMPAYDKVQRSRRWGALLAVLGAILVGMLTAGTAMMMMHA